MLNVNNAKRQLPDEEIVKSLINLRDELFDRRIETEIFYKINSCLYRGYPHKYSAPQEMTIDEIEKKLGHAVKIVK